MVPNGCRQFVFRTEISRGYKLGVMGIDAASSAQSKRTGGGVERGGTGLRGGETRDGGCKTGTVEVMAGVGVGRGVSTGVDGVVRDTVRV
jgi:hypothetical protein